MKYSEESEDQTDKYPKILDALEEQKRSLSIKNAEFVKVYKYENFFSWGKNFEDSDKVADENIPHEIS